MKSSSAIFEDGYAYKLYYPDPVKQVFKYRKEEIEVIPFKVNTFLLAGCKTLPFARIEDVRKWQK